MSSGELGRRERIHRGAHHVDRVARAVALGEHVAHAGALEHRAHAAARDDAGTVGRGLHVDLGRAMRAVHREVQRVVLERDVDHVLARLRHRLGDGDRHFTRLAESEADAAGAVADHRQRGEAELAATLDHLRRAVDRDQLLEELVLRPAICCRVVPCCYLLKLEAGFTRGIGQRLHAAVIHESRAIERDLGDARGLGAPRRSRCRRPSRPRRCRCP